MTQRYRERSKDSKVSSTFYSDRIGIRGTPNTGSLTPSGAVTLDIESMQDFKNPGYFKAEREGLLKPVSPMGRQSTEWLAIPGAIDFEHQIDYGPIHGVKSFRKLDIAGCYVNPDFTAGFPSVAWPTVDKEDLLQNALVYAQTNAWDVATFTAEFNKTVEMLSTFRGRMQAHYEKIMGAALRKQRGSLTISLADVFASLWLEARYGFRPLYHDMLSIQEAVNKVLAGTESSLSRGWDTAVAENSGTQSSFSSGGVTAYNWVKPGYSASLADATTTRSCLRIREVEGHASVGVTVSTRQVTMFDPLVTAWEVFPFSFVVDWFFSIGDVLRGFSPFATGKLQYATYTETRIQTDTISGFIYMGSPSQGGTYTMKATPCSLTRTTKAVARTVTSVTPHVGFRLNISTAKVVDLIALVWSLKLRHLKLLQRR